MIANATRSILIFLLLNIISSGAVEVEYMILGREFSHLDETPEALKLRNSTGHEATLADKAKCTAIKLDKEMYLHAKKNEVDSQKNGDDSKKNEVDFVVEGKVFPYALVGFPEGDIMWSPQCQLDPDEITFKVTFNGLPHKTTIEIVKKGNTVKLAFPNFVIKDTEHREYTETKLEDPKYPVYVLFDNENHVELTEGKIEKKPNVVICEGDDCDKILIEPFQDSASKVAPESATKYLISYDDSTGEDVAKQTRCLVAEVTVESNKCLYKSYGKLAKGQKKHEDTKLKDNKKVKIEFTCRSNEKEIDMVYDKTNGRVKLFAIGGAAANPAPPPRPPPPVTQRSRSPSPIPPESPPGSLQDPTPPTRLPPPTPAPNRPPPLVARRSPPPEVRGPRPQAVRGAPELGRMEPETTPPEVQGPPEEPAAAQGETRAADSASKPIPRPRKTNAADPGPPVAPGSPNTP